MTTTGADITARPSRRDVQREIYPPPLPPIHDKKLYNQVFTHRSVANGSNDIEHNERLEFLGDACLSYTVARAIFFRFPHLREGDMTRLRSEFVCNAALVKFAAHYDFQGRVQLSPSAEHDNVRKLPKITADCFEAYLGALCISAPDGAKTVEDFLLRLLEPEFLQVEKSTVNYEPVDKMAKQTVYHRVDKLYKIEYVWVAGGGGNRGGYEVALQIGGKEVCRGWASNQKDAGLRAAMHALENPLLLKPFGSKEQPDTQPGPGSPLPAALDASVAMDWPNHLKNKSLKRPADDDLEHCG